MLIFLFFFFFYAALGDSSEQEVPIHHTKVQGVEKMNVVTPPAIIRKINSILESRYKYGYRAITLAELGHDLSDIMVEQIRADYGAVGWTVLYFKDSCTTAIEPPFIEFRQR